MLKYLEPDRKSCFIVKILKQLCVNIVFYLAKFTLKRKPLKVIMKLLKINTKKLIT